MYYDSRGTVATVESECIVVADARFPFGAKASAATHNDMGLALMSSWFDYIRNTRWFDVEFSRPSVIHWTDIGQSYCLVIYRLHVCLQSESWSLLIPLLAHGMLARETYRKQ